MGKAVGIIFSNLNNNTLSELTSDRTVAAIPFGCRYRLADFGLSNMINSGISNIYVCANYNYRSLVRHIGSGKDFDLARRDGGINLVSPFQTSMTPNAKLYSNHMEALRSILPYLREVKEEYVVLADADQVLNLNLSSVIEYHEKTEANITFVTKQVEEGYEVPHPRMFAKTVSGKITTLSRAASAPNGTTDVVLNVLVLKTQYLLSLIEEADRASAESFTALLLAGYKRSDYRAYRFGGYVGSVSRFEDYYKCSMDLINDSKAREELFWNKEAPIYTKVHNSAPTQYKPSAVVENSMIADECVIEGTVKNSVLFRGVHVKPGAVVENSVLFWGTEVAEGAKLNCVVTDKHVRITEGVSISGNRNLPIYIAKNRIV